MTTWLEQINHNYKEVQKLKSMTTEQCIEYLTEKRNLQNIKLANSTQQNAWEFALAIPVIGWAYNKCVEKGILLDNPATSTVVGALQSVLKNQIYEVCGCKPIGRCTIDELEKEIIRRKKL